MIRNKSQDPGFRNVRDRAGPAEALAAIRVDIHLIISDYNMPDIDSLQFLRSYGPIRSSAGASSSCLTGFAEEGVVQHAAPSPVSSYVVKPFSAAVLRDKIERVSGESSK